MLKISSCEKILNISVKITNMLKIGNKNENIN